MFHLFQETGQAREARQRRETASQKFNERVINAHFVPEALDLRDRERLRPSFARKIITIQRLDARPGDFELIG